MTNNPQIKGCLNRAIEALEKPEKMTDADMMFCLRDYEHLPYQTVKSIARSVCNIVGLRNREALADLRAFRDALPLQPRIGKGLTLSDDIVYYNYESKVTKLTAEAASDE